MKKILVIASAILAAIAFASPAAAKNGKHGHGYGKHKAYKAMPLRSNKGGYLRGQDRARYVQGLNRQKKYRY